MGNWFGRGKEEGVETVVLGAGCYWGTEKFIRKHKFETGKIVDVRVGFAGGDKPNPTYREVCTGSTGHVEVAEVKYTCQLEELLKFFFTFHDPTTMNRQGNDRGTQYASVIYVTEKQRPVAEATVESLQKAMDKHGHTFSSAKVTTQVRDVMPFYPAHAEHQRYLEKNPSGYCNHKLYLSTWPGEN